MKKVAVAIHAIEKFDADIIKNIKGLDFIHVDVMDGIFVKNTNINLKIFKILKENYNIPIIAHLMVINPDDYIEKILKYIDIFLFHLESKGDKNDIIKKIKFFNKKVGIVVNPNTEISRVVPFLDKIDIVLVMGVVPGWSGQKFIPHTINRVEELAKYKKKYKFEIDVDGGVNLENGMKLKDADILTSSSTILNAENPNEIIQFLKRSENK